jgi:hypothetical protein
MPADGSTSVLIAILLLIPITIFPSRRLLLAALIIIPNGAKLAIVLLVRLTFYDASMKTPQPLPL